MIPAGELPQIEDTPMRVRPRYPVFERVHRAEGTGQEVERLSHYHAPLYAYNG